MKLGFKRLYNLGNYSNITFETDLEIPHSQVSNPDFVEQVFTYLTLIAERGYREYLDLINEVEDQEEALGFIRTAQEESLNELKVLLEKEKENG